MSARFRRKVLAVRFLAVAVCAQPVFCCGQATPKADVVPLLESPGLAPCLQAIRASKDLDVRIASCEMQLRAPKLRSEEQALLHGILGSGYFERATKQFDWTRSKIELKSGVTAAAKAELRLSEQHYSDALRLQPEWPMAAENHWHRGFDRELMGNAEGAAADYSRAIALKPDFVRAFVYRARVLRSTGRIDAARADLEQAAKLAPYDAEVIHERKALEDSGSKSR